MRKIIDPDYFVRASAIPTVDGVGEDGNVYIDTDTKKVYIVGNYLLIDNANVTLGDGDGTITAASGTPFALVEVGDSIEISGSSGGTQDGTYIVTVVSSDTVITVDNTFTAEGPSAMDVILHYEGYSLQCLYSYLKEEWRTDTNLIKFAFPMESITNEQFEFFNGWNLAMSSDDTSYTRNLIRDGGWALKDTTGNSLEEYMNVTTLGAFDDSDSDQAYYIQEVDGSTTNIVLTGEVNQAVKIYNWTFEGSASDFTFTAPSTITSTTLFDSVADGDTIVIRGTTDNDGTYTVSGTPATNDITVSETTITTNAVAQTAELWSDTATDYTTFFQIFLREQGKTYASYDLINEQNISALTYKKYAMPLSNGSDLNISATDNTITTTTPYTNMTIKWFEDLTASAGDFTFANGASDTSTITSTADFDFADQGYETGHSIKLSGCAVSANDGYYEIASVSTNVLSLVGDNVFDTPQNDAGTPTINQAREIGDGSWYDFRIIINGATGTTVQIYEFVQHQLRLGTDIDDTTTGSEIGQISDEMLEFVGSTLKTKLTADGGVYIDNFDETYTNSLEFADDSYTSTYRTFPYVAAGVIDFNDNIVNSTVPVYSTFYTNSAAGEFTSTHISFNGTSETLTLTPVGTTEENYDFADLVAGQKFTISGSGSNDGTYTVTGTPTQYTVQVSEGFAEEAAGASVTLSTEYNFDTATAVIVKDNAGTNLSGLIKSDGRYSTGRITFTYDYDGNGQRGPASTGTPAPVTVVAIGTDTAQYVKASSTITRSTQNVITLVAPLERNYSNPA